MHKASVQKINKISIHFEGDIAHNHQVSMRTLGKTLSHLQSAMDRAFLENKYGNIFKHARMSASDYEETEFLVQEPKEGGYIIDFLSNNETTKKILDRLSLALTPAFTAAKIQGQTTAQTFGQQLETRQSQIEHKIIKPKSYTEMLENPSRKIIRKYGDRSIVKELDQILSIIRSGYSGESSFEIIVNGTRSHTFTFNKQISNNFHQVVSERSIGEPVIYKALVTSLDSKTKKGKITNAENDKTAIIHFCNDIALLKAKNYLGEKAEMNFIGCPLIEYGAFDPQAGDIYFLDLL